MDTATPRAPLCLRPHAGSAHQPPPSPTPAPAPPGPPHHAGRAADRDARAPQVAGVRPHHGAHAAPPEPAAPTGPLPGGGRSMPHCLHAARALSLHHGLPAPLPPPPPPPPQFLLHLAGYLLLEVSQTVLIWLHSTPGLWHGGERASQEYLSLCLACVMVGAGAAAVRVCQGGSKGSQGGLDGSRGAEVPSWRACVCGGGGLALSRGEAGGVQRVMEAACHRPMLTPIPLCPPSSPTTPRAAWPAQLPPPAQHPFPSPPPPPPQGCAGAAGLAQLEPRVLPPPPRDRRGAALPPAAVPGAW